MMHFENFTSKLEDVVPEFNQWWDAKRSHDPKRYPARLERHQWLQLFLVFLSDPIWGPGWKI